MSVCLANAEDVCGFKVELLRSDDGTYPFLFLFCLLGPNGQRTSVNLDNEENTSVGMLPTGLGTSQVISLISHCFTETVGKVQEYAGWTLHQAAKGETILF